MEWIDIKSKLPEWGEYVLVSCPRMGINGETKVLVANLMGENEWYSFHPYDQPVYPTHWMPFPKPFK